MPPEVAPKILASRIQRMKACHRCQSPWAEPGQPGFNNTCASCGMALHACANCRFYVPKGQVRCLVPGTERILDFRAGNRCKAFEFLDGTLAPRQTAAEGHDDPRAAFERLFKKP